MDCTVCGSPEKVWCPHRKETKKVRESERELCDGSEMLGGKPEPMTCPHCKKEIEGLLVANVSKEDAIKGLQDFGMKALSGVFGALAGRVLREDRQKELERLHGLAYDLLYDLRMADSDGRKERVPCIDRINAWIEAENQRRAKEPAPENGFAARLYGEEKAP